jgi:bleomycin resistance family protein
MVDMHLEVDVIPVADVDRSKQFYGRLGWRLDEDVAPADGVRIVQFTPPGSGCSVTFGKGLTAAAPGSAAGALVVSADRLGWPSAASRIRKHAYWTYWWYRSCGNGFLLPTPNLDVCQQASTTRFDDRAR